MKKLNFWFDTDTKQIKDRTYDCIYAYEVLEHLDDPEKVLEELWRICKPNALIEIKVPYYNNKGAYSDMQHKHYFSDVTFKIFVKKSKKFELHSLKLIPTKIGKVFPDFIRKKISLFIGGLISMVEVKLRVLK